MHAPPPATVRTPRRLYDALLTGLPFGVFKIAAGWIIATFGTPLVGWTVVLWGILDLLLNLAVLTGSGSSYCTLSSLGRALDRRGGGRWEERLLALDTFLSFGIVSLMIWLGYIPRLPGGLILAWNLSVVGNVMGVGVERLYHAFRKR